MIKSYNKYLTDGIQDGSIVTEEKDGCRIYRVRKPYSDEKVTEYINFSGLTVNDTETQKAEYDGEI